MFTYEAALILNRFQCLARMAELELAEEQQEPGAKDRAARDQKEKDRRAYVESGLKRIQDWERRQSGK